MVEILQKKTSGFAIASLVLGCFFIIPLLGLLTSLLAIIFGIIALVTISNNKDALKGGGLAISGLILGIVGIIIIPIIAILAAIAIPNFLRVKVNAQDAAAELRVKTISIAIQAYAAANDGKYPSKLDELISSEPPYLSDIYRDKIASGYSYFIDFNSNSYTIKAEPETCFVTGTKVFMDRNGELSEENCR
ncbi:MAG: DUF4190 domain-containing protein [Candidatus Omnitrophota bacterium]|nr:DUF4190 domain-containing protein [Candidatus Omnitrophota bacterium]